MAQQISDYKVLHSAAGYYIGTQYYDTEFNVWLPNSRNSGYYRDRTKAEFDLKHGLF